MWETHEHLKFQIQSFETKWKEERETKEREREKDDWWWPRLVSFFVRWLSNGTVETNGVSLSLSQFRRFCCWYRITKIAAYPQWMGRSMLGSWSSEMAWPFPLISISLCIKLNWNMLKLVTLVFLPLLIWI